MTNHALDVLNVHKVFLIIWTHGGYHDDHDSHGYVHNWQGVLEGMEEVTAKSSAAGTPSSIGEGGVGGNILKRGCQGKNIRKFWQRIKHWESLAIKIRKWDNYLAPVLITDQAPARELQHLPGQQAKVTPSSCGFKVWLENINQLHISFHRVRLLPHSVHPRYVSFANLLEISQVGLCIIY